MCRLMQGDYRRKQSVGKMRRGKNALDCWDNERKSKQRRTVIRRGKNCSSIHPEMYDKCTEASPK